MSNDILQCGSSSETRTIRQKPSKMQVGVFLSPDVDWVKRWCNSSSCLVSDHNDGYSCFNAQQWIK